VAALRELGLDHHVHVTAGPGEATAVARRFAEAGTARVIAVGGDGTVNETVNGLVQAATAAGATTTTVLGVVPVSRGSDFARSLGVPGDLEAAVRRAATGAARPMDVGLARFADGTERVFANIAGVGFDAVVAQRANRSRVPGATLPYLIAIVGTLASAKVQRLTVEADGKRTEERAWAVLVANGRYFGGGMRIVPAAEVADGRLDLAVLGDLSKPALLWTLPKVFWGGHVGNPRYRHQAVTAVSIAGDGPLPVELDGEVVGTTPVSFVTRPGLLLVAG
jgi:YegS/Rv2252/BmrU family lipid kinase